MARDLNKIPTIDELRLALEKWGGSLRPYDMLLLNNYLDKLKSDINELDEIGVQKYTNANLPTEGKDGVLYVVTDSAIAYIWHEGAYLPLLGGSGGTPGGPSVWGSILGNLNNQQDLVAALAKKVDVIVGKQLSTEDYTTAEKSKLSGIQAGAQVNPSASEIKTLYESNANTNAFTDAEKNKLASLSGSMTPAQIKTAYESNSNTNAFTDAERVKLSSIEQGAKANVKSDWNATSGDAQILNKPIVPTSLSDLTNDTNFITAESDPTVPQWAKQPVKPTYTKADVGLGNVDNVKQATKTEFDNHVNNSTVHITAQERANWNAAAGGGTGVTLGETASTAYRGDRGKIAYDHSQIAHAPENAQKNSDITKAEIEAKLTGTISSHTHSKSQITDFPEEVRLVAGNNVTIVESGNDLVISASGSGGGTGGTTIHNELNGRSASDAHPMSAITGLSAEVDKITNATNLVAGVNITLTPSGGNLTISASGGGGGGSSIHNDLTGRDASDAHPMSAITGLSGEISKINNAKTLMAGNNVNITETTNNIVISASGEGGGGSYGPYRWEYNASTDSLELIKN